MQLQAFQPWERRDENDNIIRAGSYGKKSALANSQNTGILDYIGNNLDVLYAGFNETVLQDKIANNLTTTAAGYVLDARQGKTLQEQIANLGLSVVNGELSITYNV